MKIECFPETDSFYIERADRPSDTRKIEEGVILDVDEHGRAVGFDIDQASKHLDLKKLNLSRLPFDVSKLQHQGPNKITLANAGIALWVHAEHFWPGIAEFGYWAHCANLNH